MGEQYMKDVSEFKSPLKGWFNQRGYLEESEVN